MTTSVVACGYPKSGTTWLARLVAELADCPLQGNWGFQQYAQQDVEGLDRVSEYVCYKSHHMAQQIHKTRHGQAHRIIYIVRDPRDVAVSAMHHFNTDSNPILRKIVPRCRHRRKILNAIIEGDSNINEWLAVSWIDHVSSYRTSGALMVTYENLLQNPVPVCKEILSYLGIDKSESHVEAAIEYQSFENRKKQFLESGQDYAYKFLRQGGCEYWRNELSSTETARVVDALRNELQEWSYSLH